MKEQPVIYDSVLDKARPITQAEVDALVVFQQRMFYLRQDLLKAIPLAFPNFAKDASRGLHNGDESK